MPHLPLLLISSLHQRTQGGCGVEGVRLGPRSGSLIPLILSPEAPGGGGTGEKAVGELGGASDG